MSLKTTMEVEIEAPTAPHNLHVKRQGRDAGYVGVGELSNKELRRIADSWVAGLMANAEKQRKEKAPA